MWPPYWTAGLQGVSASQEGLWDRDALGHALLMQEVSRVWDEERAEEMGSKGSPLTSCGSWAVGFGLLIHEWVCNSTLLVELDAA